MKKANAKKTNVSPSTNLKLPDLNVNNKSPKESNKSPKSKDNAKKGKSNEKQTNLNNINTNSNAENKEALAKKMEELKAKKKKRLEKEKKELKEQKEKDFKEKIKEEKELISKRKKKNDDITNNINKHAKEKTTNPGNYIYNKLKEKFDEKQKKLLDKIHLMKKEPVMRKNYFDELEKKVNEQKIRMFHQDQNKKRRK